VQILAPILPGWFFSHYNALRQIEAQNQPKSRSHTAIPQITASNGANNRYLPLSRMR
jgi:hypothetical protein